MIIEIDQLEKLEIEVAIVPRIEYYREKIAAYKKADACHELTKYFEERIVILRKLIGKLNE